MRIMIDTNILIMGGVLQSRYIQNLFKYISENHKIILSDYIIKELKTTTKKKFSDKYDLAEKFLREFVFDMVITPEEINKDNFPMIRDIKDFPILAVALIENIDIVITNDIDFKVLEIEYPEILTPKEFLDKYSDFT